MTLFEHLSRNVAWFNASDADADAWRLRDSLRLVSALTPQEAGMYVGYFESINANAYQTFTQIYDEDRFDDAGKRINPNAFAPSPDDDEAPHTPLKIMWNEALRAFNPLAQPELLHDPIVHAAFEDFLNHATARLGLEA